MPEKVKRLRVLAGPNGSGKTTVVRHILETYNCGHFINADEIENLLKAQHRIDLSPFHIENLEQTFQDYLKFQGKSWIDKAYNEGAKVNLSVSDNFFMVSDLPGSYDAALCFFFQNFLDRNIISHFASERHRLCSHPYFFFAPDF